MGDLLVIMVIGLIAYIVVRVSQKQPIIPPQFQFWRNNETTMAAKKGLEDKLAKKSQKNKNKQQQYEEQEPDLFEELVEDLIDINYQMIRCKNYRYVMMAEVYPCNYFLRSQAEQEAIDSAFESWLATLDYPTSIYIQNKFIDLSEPLDEMKKNMSEQRDMPRNALKYGASVVKDLEHWQSSSPRYETKRYLLFSYDLKTSSVKLDDGQDFEEAAAEKAFNELMRRMQNASTQLQPANIKVAPLAKDGIIEVLYHTFNRRKALKAKFKNVKEKEQMALYVTADQTDSRVQLTKELVAAANEAASN
ncbi:MULTISPECIES: hypothetical protein [Bacillus cereus group]|uniref:PXO1-76 n=3 Tax=Bacillus cereus group TaxID=86661 RepID=A0A0J1HXM8_BACAN|nr:MULTISPECIES: hypothetical protein [Bacillus cereus group]EOQ19810.1 hypothetical protein IKC_04284 [Bacillus cereus VD184]KLV18457.1 hypothetical protein ABW01_13885 [Bacillus anthracis]OUB76859.1 hypothetical protein BK750_03020 [Bacillus thuringiensis serovar jegathesan]HDR4589549.1 hypothetical protein [Bacillus cytotoxicus]